MFSLSLVSNKRLVGVNENIFASVFYFPPVTEILRKKKMKHHGSLKGISLDDADWKLFFLQDKQFNIES